MKKIRLGINGFGRIGKLVARIAIDNEATELVAINSRAGADSHAYLLEYDSVHGRFPHKISAQDSFLVVDGKKIHCFQEEEMKDIPWEKAGVEVVMETTGKMKDRGAHFREGVKKVIVSYPFDEADKTIVLGVNQEIYDSKTDEVVSNGSCTTNCLAILCKVLDDQFGIKRGFASTCHAPTMSQRILDGSSKKDKRRGRTAFLNIIPTSTGAAKAIGKVIPGLSGRLGAIALRVPVADASIVDLVVETDKKVSAEIVNQAFVKATRSQELKGILEVSDHGLVSQDVVGQSASAIFDLPLTQVIGDNLVKVFGWYDNEWGYSCRLVELIFFLTRSSL